MHSKSSNKEFMIYGNANNIADKYFKSVISSYQNDSETSARRINFVFDSMEFFY